MLATVVNKKIVAIKTSIQILVVSNTGYHNNFFDGNSNILSNLKLSKTYLYQYYYYEY